LIVAELTPGQQLKAELQRQGLSQADLAVRMGYSPSSVYRLVTDRSPFTPGIDRSLHRALGSEPGFWLGVYQAFRERLGLKP
jgi:addiction module HigA family antidote